MNVQTILLYMNPNSVFVACPSRLGHIKVIGPKTNKEWIITPQGVWIDKIDWDDELENEKIPYYCFRTRQFEFTKLYETSHSA